MAYFPYALPRLFVSSTGTIATTGQSQNMTAGTIGMFDKNDHSVVTAANAASHPYVYIAQGSYYTVDNLTRIPGGTPMNRLLETEKTPGINAQYVTRFYKQLSQTPQNHIIQVGGSPSIQFEADTTYNLLVEAQGAQSLRVLDRNFYKHIPYYTGCSSTECLAGCDKEYVDPVSVYANWASYINADPLASIFVQAQAYEQAATTTVDTTSGSTTATLTVATGVAIGQVIVGPGIPANTTVANVVGTTLTLSKAATATQTDATMIFGTPINVATYVPDPNQTAPFDKVSFMILSFGYIDTVFNDCSFSPLDYFNKAPLIGYVSLVDKLEDVCTDTPKINSNVNQNTTQLQAPVQGEGFGETVIRDYILSRRYHGLHFNVDPRKRQIENDPLFTVVNRAAFYTRYWLQFSVPHFSNSTNTFNNTQYLWGFAFPSTVSVTAFEGLMNAWLAANKPSVTLQTII